MENLIMIKLLKQMHFDENRRTNIKFEYFSDSISLKKKKQVDLYNVMITPVRIYTYVKLYCNVNYCRKPVSEENRYISNDSKL